MNRPNPDKNPNRITFWKIRWDESFFEMFQTQAFGREGASGTAGWSRNEAPPEAAASTPPQAGLRRGSTEHEPHSASHQLLLQQHDRKRPFRPRGLSAAQRTPGTAVRLDAVCSLRGPMAPARLPKHTARSTLSVQGQSRATRAFPSSVPPGKLTGREAACPSHPLPGKALAEWARRPWDGGPQHDLRLSADLHRRPKQGAFPYSKSPAIPHERPSVLVAPTFSQMSKLNLPSHEMRPRL